MHYLNHQDFSAAFRRALGICGARTGSRPSHTPTHGEENRLQVREHTCERGSADHSGYNAEFRSLPGCFSCLLLTIINSVIVLITLTARIATTTLRAAYSIIAAALTFAPSACA